MAYRNEHAQWLLKVKKNILKRWANDEISWRDAMMMLYDIGVPTEASAKFLASA